MRKINIPTPEHGFETLATSLSNASDKKLCNSMLLLRIKFSKPATNTVA